MVELARELDERDIRILRILAPECEDLICSGSRVEFRSILPPVANHFSLDEHDFGERIKRLTNEDLEYIVGKIRSGEESVACIPPEHAGVLAEIISAAFSGKAAAEIMDIYETSDEC